jgi:RNA polymerase sigma-70 factor (ECF subfamily)
MEEGRTTAAVQDYLDELNGMPRASTAEPLVSALLGQAVRRLQFLCATLLHRSYPRLTRPPLNLQTEELLGAVVERLLKALRDARPGTVRQFFALANQHIRWELNDLARRFDERPPPVEVHEDAVAAPASDGSGLSPDARRMLAAIDALPEDEREALSLVRFQGLTHAEAAEVLGVATKTVQRRLNRALLLLTAELGDLRPATPSGGRNPDRGAWKPGF